MKELIGLDFIAKHGVENNKISNIEQGISNDE